MCFCIRPWVCFRYACLKSTLCMLLHLSALIALLRGLSLSPPRCPCPVFCLYLSVEACLSPSLPFAVFALRLVGCDNVCCSSLVLSITAGSRRFPVVNSQSIYVPFGLVNSKEKKRKKAMRAEMQQHTESAHKTCIPETTTRANAETHPTTQTLGPPRTT